MADKITKLPAQVLLSGCVNSTALAFPTPSSTKPATATATGKAVIDCLNMRSAVVYFGGVGADGKDYPYQVIGHREGVGRTTGRAWQPLQVASGSVTLGATACTLLGASNLAADTITETDSCGLAAVISPANDKVAALLIDVSSFDLLEIDVSRDGASAAPTSMAVAVALSDTTASILGESVTISGTVTASGPLTDTELRAVAVPVSGPITNAQNTAALKAERGVEAIAASGQILNCAADDTDYNVTVVAGAAYTVTAENGIIYFGVADATGDAARMWTCPAGAVLTIKIPAGITTLHYATESGAGILGRLARIVNA